MSEDLNKIGKKAKIAFQRKISTKLKNKVLIDFYNLIKKNKKKIIFENKKDIKFAKLKGLKANRGIFCNQLTISLLHDFE